MSSWPATSAWGPLASFPDSNSAVIWASIYSGRRPAVHEVQDFYTKERMKSAGWVASEQGCVSDTEDQQSQGAVCLFNRQDGTKKEGLAIVLAQDEKSKQTDIFYARVDLTDSDASPSP